LRRGIASNNSSAVYLAALAIDDLAFMLLYDVADLVDSYRTDWPFLACFLILTESAFLLEPLLVLGFSVERLIAILRPLQVCCMFV